MSLLFKWLLVFLLLQLSDVDLKDTAEGDDRSWGIWHEHRGTTRKVTLQAQSVVTCLSWLKDLRDLQQRSKLPLWSECAPWSNKVSQTSGLLNNLICMLTGAPCFKLILTDPVAKLGETIKLLCNVTGIPKPVVTWYKGNIYFSVLLRIILRNGNIGT